jgi:hypothetical protein
MTMVFNSESPYDGHQDNHFLFNKWVYSGCEHTQMRYASEIINWTGYRAFQQTLEAVGWDHFPVLRAELPNTNDGIPHIDAVPAMLGS